MFLTPILYLCFNRLEEVKQTFPILQQIRPERLYIAADGPRDIPGEAQACQEVRQFVLSEITWPCEVKTLFRDNNVGCKHGVASAITWFFSYETQGIILEDDCVPDLTFFPYCRELLAHYQDQEQVMHISGFNDSGRPPAEESYYFSNIPRIWGWATWKRAWEAYDVTLARWTEPGLREQVKARLKEIGGTEFVKVYEKLFDQVQKGKIDTWDYQWAYCLWENQGLSITPCQNLIENIGFTPHATHTKTLPSGLLDLKRHALMGAIQHPSSRAINQDLDAKFYKKFTSPTVFQKIWDRINLF